MIPSPSPSLRPPVSVLALFEDRPAPVRHCACGTVIGDGDYASGQRSCMPCRLRAVQPRVAVDPPWWLG